MSVFVVFFFSSRRRHTRCGRDWSSDVCSSDLRHPDLQRRQVGAGDVARQGPGVRLPRRATRRARPLGADRGPEDLPLPVRGAEHVELLATRREGRARAVRSGAHGPPPAGEAGPAARNPAHHPLVRPVHGVRGARAGRHGQPRHRGEGPVRAPAAPGGISLARKVPPPSGEYRWVYLWGWPLRAMHWAAVASIVVAVVTGFYIGAPYFIAGGEASAHYLM